MTELKSFRKYNRIPLQNADTIEEFEKFMQDKRNIKELIEEQLPDDPAADPVVLLDDKMFGAYLEVINSLIWESRKSGDTKKYEKLLKRYDRNNNFYISTGMVIDPDAQNARLFDELQEVESENFKDLQNQIEQIVQDFTKKFKVKAERKINNQDFDVRKKGVFGIGKVLHSKDSGTDMVYHIKQKEVLPDSCSMALQMPGVQEPHPSLEVVYKDGILYSVDLNFAVIDPFAKNGAIDQLKIIFPGLEEAIEQCLSIDTNLQRSIRFRLPDKQNASGPGLSFITSDMTGGETETVYGYNATRDAFVFSRPNLNLSSLSPQVMGFRLSSAEYLESLKELLEKFNF